MIAKHSLNRLNDGRALTNNLENLFHYETKRVSPYKTEGGGLGGLQHFTVKNRSERINQIPEGSFRPIKGETG